MKRSTLRWFGHNERMGSEKFVKKVYWSSVEGTDRRGRPLGRWEDRVREYVSERGVRGSGLEWARRECMDREEYNLDKFSSRKAILYRNPSVNIIFICISAI